jgi:hypothetical protein
MRSTIQIAASALIALAIPAWHNGFAPLSGAASAAPLQQRIAGTWDLSWKNRRGETRKGMMVVEQRGSQLTAQVYDRGGATATGSIAGSTFTLYGRRLAIPFTVTGRIAGRKMTGSLTALGVEQRRFTGVRRRGR